jgi:MFS family permease
VGDPPAEPGPLPREVKVLGAVSFAQDTASEMLYPVLPAFVTSVLGAPPGVVGLIEGVAEATASITKAASGQLSDRRRRRPFVTAGYGLSTFGKLLIALASTWPLVLVARFTDRLGKGIRTSPRDALIADVTPASARGRAYGFHRALDTAGAVVGPLLGLGIYHLLDEQLRPLFLIAVVPAVASVALIALVHERPRANTDKVSRRRWRDQHFDRTYWRTLTFLTAFGLVNFADALLILRATELGLSVSAIFVVYALYNLTYASLSYPAGILSDKVPRDRLFAVGLGVFAITYLGLGLATTSTWVWLLLPLYGIYTALTDGISRAWIVDLAPADHTGAALGFMQAITGTASLIAGIWAGLTWGDTGRTPLLLAGSVTAVLAAGLALFPRRLRSPTRQPRP